MLHHQNSPIVLFTVALLVLLAGCTRQVYELHLTSDGDSMERTLTVRVEPLLDEGLAKRGRPS